MTSTEKRAGAAVRQKSVEEDVLSIDSMTAANLNLIDANTSQPITLSKKAIHQRDADENLFLRFLELDPPVETPTTTSNSITTAPGPSSSGGGGGGGGIGAAVAAAAAAAGAGGAAGGRRLSASKISLGRTPFTVTKKLTRTADRGFGFSIVWTHPPRVEKIEPGLSADKNGILPGDYVIFVDKHNVVTMPEADVLNLIRSQGTTLTLETFRRSGPSNYSSSAPPAPALILAAPPTRTVAPTTLMSSGGDRVVANGGGSTSRVTSAASNYTDAIAVGSNVRASTACSSSSTMEAAKKRLHLPQVTFSKESIVPITDNRRRFLLQLVSREQNYISALLFGIQRFVQPLVERKDLISPNDHRTLFQNIDELLRISEDILEQLMTDEHEPQMNFTSRVYLSKTTAICAAYKKYLNGIKRADCVLVNKSRQAGSEFVAFITEPQVPRKRPDLTMFIHRPLQHFREILKLMQLLASTCHVDNEEHKNFNAVINELQAAYREITITSGLMEPLGEGRPLLTLQDLESRMVFTKCKPFTLAVQGRQWIFGGDLSRVEGRSVKPYWTLLFSDIIVFAKVSRDRVLFITEEPIPIANIVDSCFHMRKKTSEFRITVDPNGRFAESPTGYCAPDLTRTPKKSGRRKSLILRAPSLELKAVWQNLLQRQIFLVNAALGSTPLSSPLDSPDVLNTLVPLCDIGMATASIASMKLSSVGSINMKNQQSQQVCSFRKKHYEGSFENLQRIAGTLVQRSSTTLSSTLPAMNPPQSYQNNPNGSLTSSLHSVALSRRQQYSQGESGSPLLTNRTGQSVPNSSPAAWLSLSGSSLNTTTYCSEHITSLTAIPEAASESIEPHLKSSQLLEFSLSSVGRSFIDESLPPGDDVSINVSVATPTTPTLPNISPTSSKLCASDAFSNDFVIQESRTQGQSIAHSVAAAGVQKVPLAQFGGSWDLLELDLEFHQVNLDTNYDTDVEECVFYGDDDPYGVLPTEPTPPDSLDL